MGTKFKRKSVMEDIGLGNWNDMKRKNKFLC